MARPLARCRVTQRSFHGESQNHTPRVVVTGLGCVSPLAQGARRTFDKVLSGTSAVRLLPNDQQRPNYDYSDLPTRLAASMSDEFDSSRWTDGDASRGVDCQLYVRFALAAVDEALRDAALVLDDNRTLNDGFDSRRVGVSIGSAIGGVQLIGDTSVALHERRLKDVQPRFIPSMLVNMAAARCAIRYGLKGPNMAPATACAAGAHAIGDAFRAIQHGSADVMVCGGTESCINRISLGGFGRARALAAGPANERAPQRASRPFSAHRSGFVIGEGSGVIVLERLDHAIERGAHIYGELCGYGMSGDAFHWTSPPSDGEGARRAMEDAMRDAQLTVDDIIYMNAHATSTPRGDIAEASAISHLAETRRNDSPPLLVSSTKGATGHTLGASGGVDAIVSLLALEHARAPPTANLNGDVDDCQFSDERRVRHVVRDGGEELTSGHTSRPSVISNSFGFGGTNVSLVFSRFFGGLQ